jgi:predicted TIM-barrel fold metal-dependent hydrolase
MIAACADRRAVGRASRGAAVTTVEESLDWMYLGADNVMAESDYPHSDSSWPDSIRLMRKQLAHLSVPDQVKILRGNAERLFEFTPAPFPATSA